MPAARRIFTTKEEGKCRVECESDEEIGCTSLEPSNEPAAEGLQKPGTPLSGSSSSEFVRSEPLVSPASTVVDVGEIYSQSQSSSEFCRAPFPFARVAPSSDF